MFSTPTLFNLFITTLYRKLPFMLPQLPSLVLHCLTRQKATLRLLSGSLTDLGFGEGMLILPSIYFDLGYLNVSDLNMYSKNHWLAPIVSTNADLICQFCGKVIFRGPGIATHTQTQTKYKHISKTNPFETAGDTDPNILILKHHPTLPKSQVLHGT